MTACKMQETLIAKTK